MSIRHHDHPSDLGSVRPEDLDLYALDALDDDEAAAVEMATNLVFTLVLPGLIGGR